MLHSFFKHDYAFKPSVVFRMLNWSLYLNASTWLLNHVRFERFDIVAAKEEVYKQEATSLSKS
jgi:hypothetical protein